jgi:hypothetical protein
MKEIRGQKRGAKLEPQPNNSQRIRELDTELKNVQMAGRLTQMMLQQMLTNFQNLSKDLGKAFGVVNELQYKILAMQSLYSEDEMTSISQKAEALRLKDFEEASAAEDTEGNFTFGDKVQENSTVIITSTTQDGAGLFRSRIKLAESGVPALIQGLMGQGVGTKVKCQLNGADHEVELLGIRNPPPTEKVEQATAEEAADFDLQAASALPTDGQVH